MGQPAELPRRPPAGRGAGRTADRPLPRDHSPPAETSESRLLGVRRPLLQSTAVRRAPAAHAAAPARETPARREVRLTAQRILQLHSYRGPDPDHPSPSFWHDLNLDLTGATLINFSLRGCAVATATFSGATFTGNAEFGRATFTSHAWFGEVTFAGDAEFVGATRKGLAFDPATHAASPPNQADPEPGGGSS
ncbi:pentapeptide repeat-containing protein [Amycolatopsis sp. H6(2020)]|nr:pentapeptide repeat-containing protein [Amycolatopsis sp. H6(2020)]